MSSISIDGIWYMRMKESFACKYICAVTVKA